MENEILKSQVNLLMQELDRFKTEKIGLLGKMEEIQYAMDNIRSNNEQLIIENNNCYEQLRKQSILINQLRQFRLNALIQRQNLVHKQRMGQIVITTLKQEEVHPDLNLLKNWPVLDVMEGQFELNNMSSSSSV